MDDKDLQYKYFQDLNSRGEGYSPTAVDDSEGNPTIGSGLNLRSPATAAKLQLLTGVDPSAAASGMASISPEQAEAVRKSIYDDKAGEFGNMQNTNFPASNLNPAQHAAMMDLMYENPHLIGPALQDKLNKNDSPGVVKELLLNSNASNSPGELKRRLDQAQTYGGPVDFNMTLKRMTPDERDQVRQTLNKMNNANELKKVYSKYPLLDPSTENEPAPATFYKMGKLLGDDQ